MCQPFRMWKMNVTELKKPFINNIEKENEPGTHYYDEVCDRDGLKILIDR